MNTPPVLQVEAMVARTYFRTLADLMGSNPPSPNDQNMVDELAKIGIVVGKLFNINTLDAVTRRAITDAYPKAQEDVKKATKIVSPTATNWSMSLHLGSWVTPGGHPDYITRAAVAYAGLGANLYKDAVYALAFRDGEGNNLTGNNCYTLTFDNNALPPVNSAAFWSVTLYNSGKENLFNPQPPARPRNGVGIPTTQGNDLIPNGDGSYTLYIQPYAPSTDSNSMEYHNWLPTPLPVADSTKNEFILLLRMYWPTEDLFNDDGWIPPALQKQAACIS